LITIILEVEILNIDPGLEKKFEGDFDKTGKYISSIKGYLSHSLRKYIEQGENILPIGVRGTINHHNVTFRGSNQYQEWKSLLHDYYDLFPIVEHYETVTRKLNYK
jgi:heme-degrading monooxygenase HmoA